ncbi:type II toxin-antitoxin system VapC family toxin [Candidatus Woesearchaeota archaeon]|nr:type II toxin-antitoxin system VapC family toxin [Candidatus Woesearchaeota archaeon]
MNALIDSNVFIAAWHPKGQKSDLSISILDRFDKREIQCLFTTNDVVVEVINFLLRKVSFSEVWKAFQFLTKAERLKVIFVDSYREIGLDRFFEKFQSLSLTDSSLLAMGQEKGINALYSFDPGFDKVKEIMRLEQ